MNLFLYIMDLSDGRVNVYEKRKQTELYSKQVSRQYAH